MSRKRTPEEILASIEEPSLDEEMDRVLAMTPEQRRAELEAAGFDLNELHAEADAWHEKMKQAGVEERKKDLVTEARAKSLRPVSRRRPVVVGLLAAALGAAAVGGAAFAYVHWREAPPPAPSPPPPTVPEPPPSSLPIAVRATTLRRQGLDACAGHMWQRCVEDLDQARELDPAGDADDAVQSARQEAAKWLGPDKPRPPKAP